MICYTYYKHICSICLLFTVQGSLTNSISLDLLIICFWLESRIVKEELSQTFSWPPLFIVCSPLFIVYFVFGRSSGLIDCLTYLNMEGIKSCIVKEILVVF